MKLLQGGEGSGNFGHEGRPGQVGGSSSFTEIPWDEEKYNFEGFPSDYYEFSDEEKSFIDTNEDYEINHYIGKYVDEHYHPNLQSYLRNPNPGLAYEAYYKQMYFADEVEHLDKYISQNTLARDVTLFRGTKEIPNWMDIGVEFSDKGYTATTISREIVEGFSGGRKGGVIYNIKVPKGTHYLPIPSMQPYSESEIVLPRNSKFRVVGFHNSPVNGKLIVGLELIP